MGDREGRHCPCPCRPCPCWLLTMSMSTMSMSTMSMSTMFRKYQINHPTHPSDTPVTGMSGATIWPLKEGALGGGIRVWPDKGFPRLKRRSFWTPLHLLGSSNCHHPFCSKLTLDNSPHHQIAIFGLLLFQYLPNSTKITKHSETAMLSTSSAP